MIYVPLTRGQVALVDDEDVDLVIAGWPWHVTRNGYARNNSVGLLHRWLMGATTGDGRFVDHVNHRRLDCRRSNMRFVSQKQNNQNTSSHVDAGSRYLGVFYNKLRGTWHAQRQRDGVQYHLGTFRTEAEAAKASEAWDGISC